MYISERNKCDRKSNLERLYLVPGRRTFALSITARSVEDETRNAELNGNRNPECWGDFSQRQIQIQQKSHFEFVPRDTSNSNPIKMDSPPKNGKIALILTTFDV